MQLCNASNASTLTPTHKLEEIFEVNQDCSRKQFVVYVKAVAVIDGNAVRREKDWSYIST